MTIKSVWTRLRKVALSQIILISVQLFLGAMVLAAASVQEDPESSLNTYGQVATLIFVAFCIPAIPVLLSATVLIKSREKVSDHSWSLARKTQLTVFIFCLATLLPAIFLLANGFPFFVIDCILGIIYWVLVNRDTKGVVKDV